MNMEFKRVSVIGLGYIGLPTAAVIASAADNDQPEGQRRDLQESYPA